DGGNFGVGLTFPDHGGDLELPSGSIDHEATWLICSFSKMAVARMTRLRPCLILARRNSVRRCCFTVRGLILSSNAISLLLQPCTSSLSTSLSRRVILI